MVAKRYIVFCDERFLEQAVAELRSVDRGIKFYGTGVVTKKTPILVSTEADIQSTGYVFIDAALPVLFEVKGYGDDLTEAIDTLSRTLDKKKTFKIEALRIDSKIKSSAKDIEVAVGSALENRGFVADLEHPDSAAYLLFTSTMIIAASGEGSGYFIADRFREVVNRKDEKISRSEFKLEEAARYFSIRIDKGTRVLDIGAAPGGWSRYCLRRGASVVAIDAASMDAGLIKEFPRLTHIQKNSDRIEEKSIVDMGKFDILLLDMNISQDKSTEIAKRFSVLLPKGGILLMTVKLVDERIARHIGNARELMSEQFESIKLKKLPHNRKEVTLFAVKK
jgi:23S rRNA (cytidine2498-2'-O)-methyltransferase